VVIEAVRSWSSLGGPWGLLGASQWRVPALLAPASLGGVWLVSFLVLVANTAVAAAVGVRGARPAAAAVAVAGLAVAAGPLWYWAQGYWAQGDWAQGYGVQAPPAGTASATVAVVQPGLVADAGARLDRGLALTERLPPGRFDLVVWGESSVGFDLDERPDLLARLRAEAARLGSDLLVNTDARAGVGGIRKTSVLIGPGGVRGRYTKMRLVPFGEYVPFRPVFGWLTGVTGAAPEDRRRGAALAVLRTDGFRTDGFRFTPLVCFESAFPDMSRTAAADGATLLVFQTATSTFQGSWAPAQHASLAAVRAVETGRATVHATLTGTSAAFDPRGHRLAWLDTHRSGVVEVTVPLPAGRTPYVRYGDWLVGLSFLVVIGAVLVAALRRPAPG
jgi:apolipoprotein N-acyltransferase